ncbi:MAG TPA: hypothetical protein DCO79_09765 [Spirochaeta sp.]|nr:hypothetical protein [Spirochaeta sp.]
MRVLIFVLLLFFTVSLCIFAQEMAEDTNSDGNSDRWITINAGKVSEIALDRDYNGDIDYIVKYNDISEKIEEQLDFNYDGEMDDYYYYARDKMKRREIDTNYDGKIDVWVYLDGIYIEKYEKDTDFDGRVDIVKDYSKE